jgi:predicted chitinase
MTSPRPRLRAFATSLILVGLCASVVTPAAAAEPPAPARAAPALAAVPATNALPVPAPTTASFSDDWHACRDGCSRQHKGNDVFAPEGTPLVAVEAGVIGKVDGTDDSNGGLSIWLLGDSGVAYWYAHNSANYVAAGQRVGRGQVIGRVGHTGNARTTPSHIHFQMNRCGEMTSDEPCTVDPFEHLSRWSPGEVSGGADALGLYRRSQATVELRIEGGSRLPAFAYGRAPEDASLAVAGDWNGDGRDTIGIYRAADATFALRDDAGGVLPPIAFGVPGEAGVMPVAGDWNGDGRDTIGIYRAADASFVLQDDSGAVLAPLAYGWPAVTDAVPVVGDWDGDGRDSLGLYRTRDGLFRLRDELGRELPPVVFGTPGGAELPVAGDWDGDGRDSVGVYQRTSSTFVLGGPDPLAAATGAAVYPTGDQGGVDLVPLVGDWNGLDVVTLDDLRAIFGPFPDEAALAAQLPVLNDSLLRAGATTPARKAAFLATIDNESGFRPDAVEAANRSTYRGRGLIQLTGLANYRSAGADLGLDLVAQPDLAVDPATSARLAAWYWTIARDINYAADRLDMAAVNMAVGFRPSVREDMQRCDAFIRGLKWFGGGALHEGVNCERSARSRLVALATLLGGGSGRTAGGPGRTGRDGPLATTTAPSAVLPPDAGAPVPPAPAPDAAGPVLPPGILPSGPTTTTTRPPNGPPPVGGPPSSDPSPPSTSPETTTTVPDPTTTTTVPETTSTTSDIPPEWTDPGGGINP